MGFQMGAAIATVATLSFLSACNCRSHSLQYSFFGISPFSCGMLPMTSPDSPLPDVRSSSPDDELTVAPSKPTFGSGESPTSGPRAEAAGDDEAPVLEIGRVLGGYRLEKHRATFGSKKAELRPST